MAKIMIATFIVFCSGAALIGHYYQVRPNPPTICTAIELPIRFTEDPTDGGCYAAAMWMARQVEKHGCIYLTNDGWVPSDKRFVDKIQISRLLQGDQ